ncbi:hypothetical protein GGD56_003103 [Rhizobium mongolense]|uniref:Uncharacterized protein n=1 Tax=Rhizobium mongolense TaxID=57676 RepID=A0ABR6IN45_9HYPH|nr:hypothetical protein [Rhizobium mongolense]
MADALWQPSGFPTLWLSAVTLEATFHPNHHQIITRRIMGGGVGLQKPAEIVRYFFGGHICRKAKVHPNRLAKVRTIDHSFSSKGRRFEIPARKVLVPSPLL